MPKPITAPAFQFYPKDFISSTKVQRMSLTEIGAYTLLLSHCWLDGGLPTDVKQLARIVKIPDRQFAKMWEHGPLSECFYERKGRLQNERLDKERKKQDEFRRRQSDRATSRWSARRDADSGNATAMPRHSHGTAKEPQCGNDALLSPISDLQSPVQGSTNPVQRAREEPARLDIAFQAFRDAYPASRRKGGFMAQQAFVAACEGGGGPGAIMAALENHKASDQWQQPDKIPGMDKWLTEERWRQELPAAKPVGVGMTSRTAGNVEAIRRFVNRGQS